MPVLSSRFRQAKARAAQFKTKMDRFFKKHPPRQVVELNAQSGLYEFKIKFTALPDSFALTAVEFTEHLRAVLDHCGHAVCVAEGRIKVPDSAHFPFGPDDRYVNGRGKSKHLPDPIFTVMRSFQPYKGGNDILWALNKAVGTSKHELIAPMCVGIGGIRGFELEHIGGHTGGPFEVPGLVFDREKNEIVLARMGKTAKFNYKGRLAYSISFEHVDTLRNQPALAVMAEMLKTVGAIVEAVEAKARAMRIAV